MIVFSNSQNAVSLTRAVFNKKLKILTKGVYVDNKSSSKDEITKRIEDILIHLKVDGIISYSSGLYNSYFDDSETIWIVGKTAREIILENMKIIVIKGNEKEKNDYATNLLPNSSIKVPNIYRSVLQNFSKRKVDKNRVNKIKALETLIIEAEKIKGDCWSVIYANLKSHAYYLGYEKEACDVISELEKYKKPHKRLFLFTYLYFF